MKEVTNVDGTLKSNLDQCCLTDLIQICFLCYKLDLPYSKKMNKKMIDQFIQTEKDLEELSFEYDDFLDSCADLAYDILKDFDPMNIIPRHGPGGVATGEKDEEKWIPRRKYNSIHRVYPYYEYFVPSRASLLSKVQWYKSLKKLESGTALVKLVPKDSRGPRLISMEPLEYQFIQQGIARELMHHLEKRCYITRGYLNFEKQCVNRNLALWNSCSRSYATLDMKEASDRVSLKLVECIFSKLPLFLRCIKATRSESTELPWGEIITLRKFAPMGSALCFPVESLIFFIMSEVLRRNNKVKGRVYVYGDDIIVPSTLSTVLFTILPIYGLQFNERKSFVKGYFRESCGLDAYKGHLCTPTRLKKPLPQKWSPLLIQSAVDFSNRLFERGYWRSADFVKNTISGILPISAIRSTKDSFGGLAYSSFSQKGIVSEGARWHKDYHRIQFRAYCLINKTRKSRLKRDWRLFANLCGQLTKTYVVPRATKIKLRWLE